jgi:4-hydroxy-tetrahydrodipicolinate synthase
MTMQQRDWAGVFSAITTPFAPDLSVDHAFLREHARWLVDNGCTGIVPLGSLGESATLAFDEKIAILESCVAAVGGRVPVVAGVAGLSTIECVSLARRAAAVGCDGLMVLPVYVYRGDWRETEAHFSAVIEATPLSCMLYNNPIAYGTDVTAEQLAELARHDNLQAVKESSGDVRRVTAVLERLGNRLEVFAGLDDMIVESVAMGAAGWIAGLVNALPLESVRLFELAKSDRWAEARALYDWFLPLLRLDTLPKFVQLIKLVQAEVDRGSARVRPPRLEVTGEEYDWAIGLIRERLSMRPRLASLPNEDGDKARSGVKRAAVSAR